MPPDEVDMLMATEQPEATEPCNAIASPEDTELSRAKPEPDATDVSSACAVPEAVGSAGPPAGGAATTLLVVPVLAFPELPVPVLPPLPPEALELPAAFELPELPVVAFEPLVTAPLLLVAFEFAAPVVAAGAACIGPAVSGSALVSAAVAAFESELLVLAEPEPLGPESPELPVVDIGSATDVELAAPVLPVLVAVDCAVAAPLSPLRACGDWSMLELPPAPPSADVLPMESPPLTLPTLKRLRLPTRARPLRSPARPDVAAVRKPPALPLPPVAVPRVSLAAGPVVPDVASTPFDSAPELASDLADATA